MKESVLTNIIVANIVSARKKRGWNQSDFAKKLGKCTPWLNRMENGNAVPTLSTLELMANALNVQPADLLRIPGRKKKTNKPIQKTNRQRSRT
jgi:transcriptional regulator with XRE-family HTH domain